MIDMQRQWCVLIDVTNVCNRACSNCTRLVGHTAETFYMNPEQFEHNVRCLSDFPVCSPIHPTVRTKMIGMMGGEPLMHPKFTALCRLMASHVPARKNRGLWTGLAWRRSMHRQLIEDTFGHVHYNPHYQTRFSLHSPVLVAVQDVINDEQQRRRAIDNCWLQSRWCGTVTPKGLFFCEVAGAFDWVMQGPGGLVVEPGCWRRPLADFRGQIDRWCLRCGIPLNLQGRRGPRGDR